MTVSTTESRIGYNGNGATTAFAFPYRFLANADLVVTLVRADTTQVVQTLNTDYTVTGAGDDAGGTVTMVVPPATGQQLVIVRDVPLTQETDYISGDPFPAESHETALDKLTMISQRLNNLISRSIRLSDADLLVSSTILPSPIANATLVWNATGTAIVNGVGSGEFVGLSPYMEVVLGSVDATEARANLGALGTTGAESAAGVKTFSDGIVLPTGTFTPTIESSGGGAPTYSIQLGRWTKVGNRYLITIDITLATLGTLAAGTVTIRSLPFTANSTTNNKQVLSLFATALAAGVTSPPMADIAEGTSSIRLWSFSAGSAAALTVSQLSGTSVLRLSGIVEV